MRFIIKFLLLSVSIFLFSCCTEELDGEFPEFEPLEVTDSMYFFFDNANYEQFLAVDLSTDKIVKRYHLDSDKNITHNFTYVEAQKKCYFVYDGHRDSRTLSSLAEFNPTTAKIKFFGDPTLGGTVSMYEFESDHLLLMDNHNEKIYRYYYETGELTFEPYKFLGTPFKYDGDIYVVASDSIYDIDTQRYIYNWTKQKDLDIDLNEYFPDLLEDYIPNETFHFVSFFEKGIVGKRVSTRNDETMSCDIETTLYRLEEFGESKFKVSEPLMTLDVGCYESFEYGDCLYFNTGEAYEDILKYNPQTNEILDSFRNHYPDVKKYDFAFSYDQFYQVGKYVYTINHVEEKNPTVLKINLEDFSMTVIK